MHRTNYAYCSAERSCVRNSMKRREVTKREVAASLGALALSAAMPLERGGAGRGPPDHHHRALLARHRHRHPGALDRDRPVATLRPAGGGRQPHRRQRQYRHRHGGARRARRQHAADDRQGVRGQSEPVQERALRSGQELRPDHQARHRHHRAGGASVGAGERRARIRRLCEVAAAGLGQLRLGRLRHAASPVDGAVQAGGGREPHAHSRTRARPA